MSRHNPIPEEKMEAMLWIPGQGPDESRVLELARIFGKPSEPLGEAWFMGETREMYDELNAGGIEAVSNEKLAQYLSELVSGIWYFPRTRDWEAWYGYLTTRILLDGRFLGEEPAPVDISVLWDGLIALSWVTRDHTPEHPTLEHEAEFAQVLLPLIMHPQFWPEGRFNPRQKTALRPVSCRLPTSLLLAWRYLSPEALRPWLRSVLAIDDDLWRAQILVWLQQVEPIFRHGSSTYSVLKECGIEKMWPGSSTWLIAMKSPRRESDPPHWMEALRARKLEMQGWELIPPPNIAALRTAIAHELDEETCSAWIAHLSARYPQWALRELANLPQVLAALRASNI